MDEALYSLKRQLEAGERRIDELENAKEYYERQIAYTQQRVNSFLVAIEKLETSTTKQQGEDPI